MNWLALILIIALTGCYQIERVNGAYVARVDTATGEVCVFHIIDLEKKCIK